MTGWGHSDEAAALLVKIAAGAREGYLTPGDKQALKDLLIRAHAGESSAGAVLAECQRRISAARGRQQRALAAFRQRQAAVDRASGYKRKRPLGGGGGGGDGGGDGVPAATPLERVPSGRGGVKQKVRRRRGGGRR